MNRHEGAAESWFESVLKKAGIDPDHLASARSGRRPVVERNNPWKDPEGIEAAGPVLDAVLGQGRQPGRILFVTDVEDDPIARVQAGVQLSRAAVARGLDVLVVDSDIRHVGLSRWLPDRDLDAEGLVDVLQYGASVAAARRPSEIDGIDVLGVGSYRPDAAGVFGDDDLRRLHAQLKVAASLVIIVGPARLDERHFHPVAGSSDAVVLSMHMDASLAGAVGEFLAHLAEQKRSLSGVFSWAGPDDSERFVDDALLERSRVLPRATAGSPFPGRGPGGSGPEAANEAPGVEEDIPTTAPLSTTGAASGPVAPADSEEMDEGPQSVRIRTERPRPGGKRGGSSSVVRGFFIALAVVIVAFVGWWVVTWKSVEPSPSPAQRQEPVVAESTPEAVTEGTEDPSPVDSEAESGGDTEEVPAEVVPEEAVEAATPASDPVETSRDADELLAQPVETADEDVPPAEVEDPFEAGLKGSGASGWGLYVNSFANQAEAEADRAQVERQGYSAVVREATVNGQVWYRVVIGHFESRADAASFRRQAEEKFHVDWVGVVSK